MADMEIKFSCACGQRVAVDSSAEGQQFPCPSCGQVLEVPQQRSNAIRVFDIFRRKTPEQLAPPIISQVETGCEDRITDKQRQFLADLGETNIPDTKYQATQRLDEIVGPINSWLAACFRKSSALDRPLERKVQIALHASGLAERLPKHEGELTDEHRLQVVELVRDTLGLEVMRAMGPVRITEKEGALTLKPRRQAKPKQIKFKCQTCGKDHAVAEGLANTDFRCDGCGQELRIPRPTRGYYAAPSESQIDQADLYGITVYEGMHRGQLNEEILKMCSDPARRPTVEQFTQWEKRNFERDVRRADERIAAINGELKTPNLSPGKIQELTEALQEATNEKQELLDEEKAREREERASAREAAREEVEFRRGYYESSFARGEDWSEFYRKPTRKQFDAIYEWLDRNKPGWSELGDVTDAIDSLFPELRR